MATRKGEAARDRILAAAWDEIDDLGVEQLLAGVSIRDVAARAGVAPSSVTYHFGTTAELADAMADWLLERSTMAPLTDLEGVEDVILDHAGNLADAIRLASDMNWARLTSDEEQAFARRVMRLFAATGSTVDGGRMSDRLHTKYWGSFLPEVAALYDRVLGRLGLHWVEPFEAETLARMGPTWLIQQWMVDRSVRPTLYGDIVVGLVSAITAPVERSRELAELEVRLPDLVDPLGLVAPSDRELADVEEQRELAAAAAGLFVERFDDVTMTEVARMMGRPVREVANRFGTVRRVAAVSFFRHVRGGGGGSHAAGPTWTRCWGWSTSCASWPVVPRRTASAPGRCWRNGWAPSSSRPEGRRDRRRPLPGAHRPDPVRWPRSRSRTWDPTPCTR